VVALPFDLNQLLLPVSRTRLWVSTLLSLLIFGITLPTLYLVLFNRHTRQGLHDLAAGSYVADTDKNGPLKIEPIWKMHWVILASLFAIFSVGFSILSHKLTNTELFSQLMEDVRVVEGMDSVQVAGAGNWTSWGGGDAKRVLVISVRWSGNAADEPTFADQIARQNLQHDPKVKEYDVLRVIMIRGYDLGFAHAQVTHPFEDAPAVWSARLFGSQRFGSPRRSA
jgi:hypothetical protein